MRGFEMEMGMPMQQGLKIGAASLFVLLSAQMAWAQDDAKAGAEVYETNCSPCHGERLANSGGMPDLRKLKAEDKAKFETAVNDGRGQMPSWSGILSDEEIGQIWAYIRSKAE